jgi:hypothetical protein
VLLKQELLLQRAEVKSYRVATLVLNLVKATLEPCQLVRPAIGAKV